MRKIHTLQLLSATCLLAACGDGIHNSAPAPTPTATLQVDKTAVNSGDSATLTWSSTDATGCQAADGWSGALAARGSQATVSITANTVFSVTCSGSGGTSSKASVTVNLIPTASVTALPTTVYVGGSATLTWSSSAATTCTGSGDWGALSGTSGSASTGALAASAIYHLTCSGPGGTSPVASATVTVVPPPAAPTVTLTASPVRITSGATSSLIWSSTNATACTASGGWSGALPASGSQVTAALTSTTTFTLTCTGPGGTTPATGATVTVASGPSTPTVSISAAPAYLASGGSSTITWSTTNATACNATGAWSGMQALSGTLATGTLTANATYTLTCSGAGGSTSASANAYIASALSPRIVALTLGRSVIFQNTLPTGSITWSVDGIAGGNASIGTVTSSGAYTTGTQTGQHTVLAVSTTDATKAQSAIVAVTDLAAVATHHNDNSRDGANAKEFALTPATVTAASFGKLAACPVDGAINAQPLWAANLTFAGVKHNVVFVATQHGSVYAFDAESTTCQVLWMVSLIDATHGAASGETPVPYTLVGAGSGDIQPEIGITSTPVLDIANGILYVVTKSVDGSQTNFYARLHALDMLSGSEKTGSPVTLAASISNSSGTTVAFDAKSELQRPGLALGNGVVYICFGSHEDSGTFYGWIFGYAYAGGAFTRSSLLNTAPDAGKAAIWMSGGAPAIDSSSNLYALTGNGLFTASNSAPPNTDYGDSLLKLSPTLSVSQYWTPSDEATDNATDHDFGAGGATVLADLPAGTNYTHVVMGGGKAGVLEVLNRDTLGGFVGATVQEITVGGLFATPAVWNNRIYVAGVGHPLQSWALASGSTVQFVASAASSAETYGWPGATPSVSAAGTQNGIVWTMETGTYCTHGSLHCGPVILHAYDAMNLGNELWKSSANSADAGGYPVKFAVPTVANGHVYVGTRGNNTGGTSTIPGELDIYGLKP